MSTLIDMEKYRNSPEFADIDWEFADMVVRRSGIIDDRLRLLAAMTLASVRNSNSCLNIHEWVMRPSGNEALLPSPLTEDAWEEAIKAFGDAISADGINDNLPLFYVSGLVYLTKYRKYEEALAGRVLSMRAGKTDGDVGEDKIHGASKYFEKKAFQEDMQQQAIAMALKSRFSIVTGGPGTGKTTVLAVILAMELNRNSALRIALCAPTGKAAARMRESILRELDSATGSLNTDSSEIRSKMQSMVPITIHRLLKFNLITGRPRMNSKQKLDEDLVVIDECSMSSLQLFYQLLDALPENGRLLLLGDKDQLASVEAGVVFADFCESESLKSNVCRLLENHRSSGNPALCKFVGNIIDNSGDLDYAALYSGDDPKFRAVSPDITKLTADLTKILTGALADASNENIKFLDWRKAKSVDEAYGFCERFKVLCALREGHYGVSTLNELMGSILKIRLYENGMPVLVTRNDSVSGLSNGDMGVCFDGKIYFPVSSGDGKADQERSFRSFDIIQLPEHEPAFAMTIHKSQGSDYENVVMCLPKDDNPLLTRELVYTGITRTRKRCLIISTKEILSASIGRRTKRWSGLADLLKADGLKP